MESKDFVNEMLNVADAMLAVGASAVQGGPTGKMHYSGFKEEYGTTEYVMLKKVLVD